MDLNPLLNLFALPETPGLLVYGLYDPWLVTLSLALAVFASWMALQMAGLARSAPTALLRRVVLATGGVALGVGVWGMHVIGMLAFTICTTVTYSPVLTGLSMLPSVGASFVAFGLISQARIGRSQLVWGALLVGLGIGTMHYTGMLAMRMPLTLRYHLPTFIASILVAVLLAGVALWVRFGLKTTRLSQGQRTLAAAMVMGGAITGMHYLGMAAARFIGMTGPEDIPDTVNEGIIALEVCVMTVALTVAAASLNIWMRHRALFAHAQAQDERQRALLAAAADGVISLNARGEVEDFNPAAERLFGYRRAEVLGRELAALLVDAEGGASAAPQTPAVATGMEAGLASRSLEMLAVKRDGTRVPVRASFSFRQQMAGDTTIVFVADIGATKAMQRQLADSEAQLRSLVSSIPGIAYRVELTLGLPILYMSDAMERILGYPSAEFTGPGARRGLADLILPEDRARTMAEVVAAAREGRPHLVEFRVRRPDGGVRWMWSNGRASRDAQGRAQWLDGVILDITERKEAERAAQRYQELVASSNDAIYSITLDGIITSWNAGAERIFGYTAREALGTNSAVMADPEQPRGPMDIRARAAAGEFIQQHRMRRRRKDGQIIELSATVSPMYEADGRITGLSAVVRDISEQMRMENDLRKAKEAAERAAEARTAFLANMSHEIRTPMNAVLGFTDVLLQTQLDSRQRRHLDTIRDSGRALLRLLNEVLDIAKLDRGAMELEPADFNLLNFIDGLTSTMGHLARAKDLDLMMEIERNLAPGVHGDELRLRQILTNLLGNAIKFTAAGSVTLAVKREEAGVHFIVRDTGIGIAPERIEAIFDPFTQADASMSRRYGGTGLGTTIARQLADLMGGRIWAESVLGEGSAFHVVVPLPPARAPLSSSAAQQAGHAQLPRLRVLAADDVPQNLELLSLLLEGQGHEVHTAPDGQLAARRAARERFDVILMDVHMPGTDGLAATRLIRAAEAGRNAPRVPVVALTASVQATDHEAARAAGMDGFAAKPVDIADLMAEMARVLKLGNRDAGQAACSDWPGAAATPADPGAQRDHAPPLRCEAMQAPVPAQDEAKIEESEHALDYASGLRRCGGKAASYQRMLSRFGTHYAESAQTIPALVADSRYSDAREATHKMRGVAANLGLQALYGLAGRLEEALVAEPRDPQHITQLAAQLPGRMQAALAAITAACADDDGANAAAIVTTDAAANAAATADALPAVTATLSRRAARGETRAAPLSEEERLTLRDLAANVDAGFERGALNERALTRLMAMLQGRVAPAGRALLMRAVDEFDFSTAREQLAALLAECTASADTITQ